MKSRCSKCSKDHPRCDAHRAGAPDEPCMKYPRKGANVCSFHGGNSPQARAKAEERVEEDRLRREAEREVRRFVPNLETDPLTAIIELVQYQSGIVAYFRRKVEDLETEQELIWGVVEEIEGDDQNGPFGRSVERAGAHTYYKLLREAQHDLADYASAALRAGFEERQVRLAERQGDLLVAVIRGVLEALNLTKEQRELVPVVVPQQLRLARSSASR